MPTVWEGEKYILAFESMWIDSSHYFPPDISRLLLCENEIFSRSPLYAQSARGKKENDKSKWRRLEAWTEEGTTFNLYWCSCFRTYSA